jgi:hypothetical protein
MKYVYKLEVDGFGSFVEMRDMREVPALSSSSSSKLDSSALRTSSSDDNLVSQEDVPSHVMITDSRQFCDEDGKKMVLYQLCIKTAFGHQAIVERRFSQFDILDCALRSGVRSHISTTFPSLPTKVTAPWVDQLSDKFTSARRIALEKYINDVIGNYKVSYFHCRCLFF